MKAISRLTQDILTTANGDYDNGRVLGVVVVLAFLGISIYAYCLKKVVADIPACTAAGQAIAAECWQRGQAFDPVAWGGGVAAVIVAVAANLWIKKDTERKPGEADA